MNNYKIEDVVILGHPKLGCQKIYDEEKTFYEKQSKELRKLNFEGLFDEILQLKEIQQLKSDNRKILILNPDYKTIFSVCGNDSYFKCKHYEKHIQNEVFAKVWMKNNYLKIQKFFDNKAIIPLVGLPFSSFEQNMYDENNYLKNNNIKPLYKGIYWDLNNLEKEFYYSSDNKPTENLEIHLQKNKIISEDYLQLEMNISPVVNGKNNVYNVIVILKNERQELNRIDNRYQFKDGKWKFLKNK
ncbi:hypothetical protein [Chryseobacterium sp. RLHN22]|uniref:hypothetical protein n=1 Tax=Chryseobacterium sp. RLHN22 TaxID=3437885 RepID=UPI003D9BFDD7